MRVVVHTWFMVGRQLHNLAREPIWIVMMLIQPMIWLLLYGQLFSRVPALRGQASSYIEFLAPGVVVMNAFFGATWSGMGMIEDLDRSVVDRFLATPASRVSIVLSQVVRAGLTAVVQALIILGVGYAVGVRVHGGLPGWLATFAAAFLLSTAFGGISQGIALLVRKEATMIAVANFLGLPLMFLSSILISGSTMPGWMQTASSWNPVDWAARAARDAIVVGGNWDAVVGYLGALLAVTVATAAFATWTLRRYEQSI